MPKALKMQALERVCIILSCLGKAEKLLYHLLKSYTSIVSIGLSGQMHGIVYINADGNQVSNLINWQDKRADQPIVNGKTTCELIRAITGEQISTGYGIATHYYNMHKALVPENAVGFCSIMDLFGMKICGLKTPVIHTSVAASFGLFDIKKASFYRIRYHCWVLTTVFCPQLSLKVK